ncbi:MAG TPA: PepSY domain-containing protein [Zeimonas sp.]
MPAPHDGSTVEGKTATGEIIMRARLLIATLALGGGILAGGTMSLPALAQTFASNGVVRGAAPDVVQLTLHEVQLRLEAMGYRELTKIVREPDRLRIKATDSQGRRVDLAVDPVHGDVLDAEVRRSRVERTEVDRASWLTLHQVQVKLEAMGYRDIEEIERERNGYEAKATSAQGQRVKLAVAPRSGEVSEGRAERVTRAAIGMSD